jgi:FRG domain
VDIANGIGPVRRVQRNPENVSDFLEVIAELRERQFGFPNDDPLGPWFRGQQRSYWTLRPKLYRDGAYPLAGSYDVEDEIREEFIVRAPILSEVKPAGEDDWEWYFLMQHYGAPTRLLDWTEGALLALYFAVKDNPGYYDAAVWALDPYRLNLRSIRKEEVIPPSATGVRPRDKKVIRPWLPPRFERMAGLPKRPIAVFPTHIALRISTQRSCFTVHGTDIEGLDRLQNGQNPCLAKIIIPSFRAQTVRRELGTCGIDEATIFPDLDGLGRSLCTNWRRDEHKSPHDGVHSRLRPSHIAKGEIGVFAIRNIKKGTRLFPGENEEMLWVEKSSVQKAPTEIRKLYEDFAVIRGDRFGCPPSFDRLTMAWYLNEPKKGTAPNVRCNEHYDFSTLRDVKSGEELTVDYSTYNDLTALKSLLRKRGH